VVESTESVTSAEPMAPVPPVAPAGPARSGWLKPLIGIAAFVIVLTVASTAAVLVVGGPGQKAYATGTPEAAFQSFVDAVQNNDWVTANTLVSASMKDRGTDAQTAAGMLTAGGTTVTIESSAGDVSRTTLFVTIQIGSNSGMPLNPSYTMGSSVDMVREADGWKLDSTVGGGK
jgi:hypothetical protein